MTEFWETAFQEKKAMWGGDPAHCAILASEHFKNSGYKEILIPGIGYGRNARPFIDAGMDVTGIEISETAIRLAREHFGPGVKIFHGSVAEMPFENKQDDGIFSFALIHLLSEADRRKFIANCYAQLKPDGAMIFITIAQTAPMFGTGRKISDRLYETMPGVRLFFYDKPSIDDEFGLYGLKLFRLISEPAKQMPNASALDFLWIECLKSSQTERVPKKRPS